MKVSLPCHPEAAKPPKDLVRSFAEFTLSKRSFASLRMTGEGLRMTSFVVLLVGIAGCASSGPGSAAPESTTVGVNVAMYPPRDLADLRLQTRAERSGFLETSRYEDVMRFIDTLRVTSADVHVTTMGQTAQGKSIPLVVLSRPVVRTAAEAKRRQVPIVYLQANIHGGEVEGKEALLALLRDLSRNRYRNVLDSLVIVAAPIYNADGNDAVGPQEQNREDQNGPSIVGQRANAQGLDLNRDYVKAEAPETRAALAFFNAWEPDVFVDLHTTDGSYHGYDLTWAPPLNPAARFSGPYTRDTVLFTVRAGLRQKLRLETFPYGNFISQDSVERGWFTYDHRPRFGTNYFGLRGRVAVLSEAYSHDPFRKRIASTYAFLTELLSFLARHSEDIVEVGLEADRRTTAFASTVNNSPFVPIRSRLTRRPHLEDVLVEETVATGDSARAEAGMPPGIRRTGRTRAVRIPVFDRFEPAVEQTLPYAWAIPAEQAQMLLEPLQRHGMFIEQLTEATVVSGERFIIDSMTQSGRAFQEHRETRLRGRWQPTDTLRLTAGSFVVRGGQPKGILALYLLEPLSDDGLVTWNFLDSWLNPGGMYPIARVMSRIPAAPMRPVRP
jgi:hypothetical protein